MVQSGETAHRGSPEVAFGRVLKAVREDRGMSQEALGFASGYHRTYISLLERGQKSPSLRTIFDLANCLEIQPSELIRRSERRRTLSILFIRLLLVPATVGAVACSQSKQNQTQQASPKPDVVRRTVNDAARSASKDVGLHEADIPVDAVGLSGGCG